MKLEDIAISDGEILELVWQRNEIKLTVKNWQEKLFQLHFSSVHFIKAESILNTELDSIQISKTNISFASNTINAESQESYASYKFFEVWDNHCILEIIASQDYSIKAL